MDWANEDYVKVYTRETADDLELSWQALALWRAMLLKFDRSGLIAVRNGWSSVARLVRMPDDVVQEGGAELVRDGRVVMVDGGIFAPNFTDAQTTPKSDKVRQRESRDKRRAHAAASQTSETIVGCHAVSRGVTPSHALSQNVTLSLSSADPYPEPPRDTADAVPSEPPPSPGLAALKLKVDQVTAPQREVSAEVSEIIAAPAGKRRSKSDPTERETAIARSLLSKLGARNGTKYAGSTKHVALIAGRLRDGYTEQDLEAVIADRDEAWRDDPKMREFRRPETLFGPETITRYIDGARTRFAKKQRRVESMSTTSDEPWLGGYVLDPVAS